MYLGSVRSVASGWHSHGEALEGRSFKPSLAGVIQSAGVPVNYPRDVEVFGESEPSKCFYKVISGAVRTYRILVDGRRQIGAFNLPGDVFGLEIGDAHTFSAEAIVDSRILVIRRSTVMAQAESNIDFARQVWALTGDELKQVQAHVLLLIKTAKERVAAFLLEMAARAPGDHEVELPMSRRDIADYLGLTIETVSRMLADLERKGAIGLPNSRRVILRNREALAAQGG
jgi:CRP/FNR family nitrogen fixation transcriptional regulator